MCDGSICATLILIIIEQFQSPHCFVESSLSL